MFFLIKLKSGQKKIAPMKWVKHLSLSDLLNRGVTFYKKKQHIVYISNNINDEPDFTLMVSESIANQKPGLYEGFIVKCFGKFFFKFVRLI